MRRQIGGEIIGIAVTEKSCNVRDAVAIVGKAVGLRVVDHLQPMFEPAQKAVIGDQRRGCRGIDPAGIGQAAQRLAGRSHAQLADTAAPDQLLGLGEKLDLADAAAADLDIMTSRPRSGRRRDRR